MHARTQLHVRSPPIERQMRARASLLRPYFSPGLRGTARLTACHQPVALRSTSLGRRLLCQSRDACFGRPSVESSRSPLCVGQRPSGCWEEIRPCRSRLSERRRWRKGVQKEGNTGEDFGEDTMAIVNKRSQKIRTPRLAEAIVPQENAKRAKRGRPCGSSVAGVRWQQGNYDC